MQLACLYFQVTHVCVCVCVRSYQEYDFTSACRYIVDTYFFIRQSVSRDMYRECVLRDGTSVFFSVIALLLYTGGCRILQFSQFAVMFFETTFLKRSASARILKNIFHKKTCHCARSFLEYAESCIYLNLKQNHMALSYKILQMLFFVYS